MNSRDAISKALTPGDMFNQKGHVWRSMRTLSQFADCPRNELLDILDEHFQGMITVRPNRSHPEQGPLVAITAYITVADEDPQVVVTGGNAVERAVAAVEAADIAMGPDGAAVLERHEADLITADVPDPLLAGLAIDAETMDEAANEREPAAEVVFADPQAGEFEIVVQTGENADEEEQEPDRWVNVLRPDGEHEGS
jgi:hypothetical protein